MVIGGDMIIVRVIRGRVRVMRMMVIRVYEDDESDMRIIMVI